MGKNLAPNNHVFYRNQGWRYPKIVRGEGVYLYDDTGKRYLDSCSGSIIAGLGHGNKEVAEYAKEQIERIAFTHLSRWTVDTVEMCCEKLCSWMPGNTLNHAFLLSGGSESVDGALKMSRQYFVERDGEGSSKYIAISKWNGFHGNTIGSLAVTGISGGRKLYNPMLMTSPKIHQFYHYRNPWGCETLKETSIKAAQELEEEILRQGPQNVMCFISEPVVGTAVPGQMADPIYFKMVREICDKYDVLWIDDEVMAGMGRTGTKMAITHYGDDIVPDIITTAKGMSCGYTPIGAVVASDKVWETIMIKGSGSVKHGHTYAGNPLSAGIAWKVMSILERDKLVERCAENGAYLNERLQELYKYPIVGEVRGIGQMCGIEFVKDQKTKEPFESSVGVAGKITNAGLDAGIVPYPGTGCVDGVRGDSILIAPPFICTKEQIDEVVDGLHTTIKTVCEQVL